MSEELEQKAKELATKYAESEASCYSNDYNGFYNGYMSANSLTNLDEVKDKLLIRGFSEDAILNNRGLIGATIEDTINSLTNLDEVKIDEEGNVLSEPTMNDVSYATPIYEMYLKQYQQAQTISERLQSDKEKIEFIKSKGLTVGMMKTSDKQEPYMVYVIKEKSELCNLRAVNKNIDLEIEVEQLQSKLKELEEKLGNAVRTSVSEITYHEGRYIETAKQLIQSQSEVKRLKEGIDRAIEVLKTNSISIGIVTGLIHSRDNS